jgi:PAS domain S-box-containing protein
VEALPRESTEEIKRLQRCINDLVSLLTLPALWHGGDTSQIVRTLLEVLLGMLRLDFIYVRLKELFDATPIEMLRVARSQDLTAVQQQIPDNLSRWVAQDPETWPRSVRSPSGDRDMEIAPLRLGLQGEMGVIVAGSRRADFPGETERLILSVAANLAVMGLQEARLLNEQKRAAAELDQRVAQRTAELAAANQQLQRSETYLAEAQKLSHTGSFGWNVARRQIFWSEETFRIFGYKPTPNVTLEMVLNRVHPDDRPRVRQAIDRTITHKEAFDFEHRLQMPDGSVKHLHVVGHALVDEPQNVQFAGAVMDITARKVTEQALRRTERRYQDLFQAMAVSFWEVDFTRSQQMLRAVRASGVVDFRRYFRENPPFVRALMQATRVVNVNNHTVALFGQGSKEELLRNIVPFWPDESLPDYVEAVLTSIERNQDFSVETRMRRRDGTSFDAHFTMRYASEDKTKGLAGIIDITARKQAFAKLETSEQRYRHLFQHMPVALWQLNASGVLVLFKRLRSEGVTDLGAHFDAHPGLLQRSMQMLIVEEVNEHTVRMLGGHNTSEFVGTSVADYFPEDSPTFRRSMVSRYHGDPNYAAETKLFSLDGRVLDVLYTASRIGPPASQA